jgi:hypothetical protein
MLVRDARGRTCTPRRYVSLSGQRGGAQWSIRRIVTPGECGIDLRAVLSDEFAGKDLAMAG